MMPTHMLRATRNTSPLAPRALLLLSLQVTPQRAVSGLGQKGGAPFRLPHIEDNEQARYARYAAGPNAAAEDAYHK